MGIIGLSDPTAQFEAVLFSEGLAQFRDQLEPGAGVLLQLTAEMQGDDVRARIALVEPLDEAAAKSQKGLRIFVRDEKPVDSIAKRLEAVKGEGGRVAPQGRETASPDARDNVSLVLMLDLETEVEVRLPGRFKVSPQIAGAIKAVPGVVSVELT
jgi:DNA polymerase-3 subunit alpha